MYYIRSMLGAWRFIPRSQQPPEGRPSLDHNLATNKWYEDRGTDDLRFRVAGRVCLSVCLSVCLALAALITDSIFIRWMMMEQIRFPGLCTCLHNTGRYNNKRVSSMLSTKVRLYSLSKIQPTQEPHRCGTKFSNTISIIVYHGLIGGSDE